MSSPRPARTRTTATITRRRAWKRGSDARTAEANLGSSASDRSICSNSRCSCSESGTALLPGQRCRPAMDRRTVTARWLLTRKSTRGYAGRKAGRGSGVGIFLSRFLGSAIPGPGSARPVRSAWLSGGTQEAGRTNRGRSEPGDGGVGGPFRLRPAPLPGTERELPGGAIGVEQPLDPDADEADAVARTEDLIEGPRGLEDLLGDVGGPGQRARTVQRTEVGQPYLDRHR